MRAATAAVRQHVSTGGKLDRKALDREQHRVHGLAWYATYAELFREHGGEELHYVPCLNDSPAHVGLLADLARRELAAWA